MAMPTVVGVSAASASGTAAITPAFPTGYTAVADDVAVTYCECESAGTITPPAGWAQIIAQSVTTGTTTKLTALWKRLAGGDTAPSIADAGDHNIGRMIVIRGCVQTGNPWDFAVVATELAADTSVSIPGSTQVAPNCLILSAFATGQDIASTAGATGWDNASLANGAERMDNWTASGLGGGFAVWSGEKAAPGAVSATTATLSLAANFKALMMIAFKGDEEPRSLLRSPRPSETMSAAGPYAAPGGGSMFIGG